jgi:hypothetical protein
VFSAIERQCFVRYYILLTCLLLSWIGISEKKVQAQPIEGPSIDLVELFRYTPDTIMSNIRFTSIMNIKMNSTERIRDIYNKIYYTTRFKPNQVVCRSEWILHDGNQIVPKVFWSVWYRPSLMTALDQTECIDTELKPWVTAQWYEKGYRALGSGVEPHLGLLWLSHWSEIQPGFRQGVAPTFKWCRSAQFSYARNLGQDAKWVKIKNKAVFDYIAGSNAIALVSRDASCTSDSKVKDRWLRTPGWSYVNILP